jgi:hypothetical protein
MKDKIKKSIYSNTEVLDTKLGKKIYSQLMEDGIDSGDFWIADIAVGMHKLFQKELTTIEENTELALREAYRAGQASVTCMRSINQGHAKPGCMCDDNLCTCKLSKTTSAEDEAVKKGLSVLAELKAEEGR